MSTMLPGRERPARRVVLAIAALLFLLFFGRSICNVVIDYSWWRELGHLDTWWRIALYRNVPGLGAWLILFATWIAKSKFNAGSRESS